MSNLMLLASGRPLKRVPYPPDFTIHIDTNRRTVDDGDRDDGFEIWPVDRVLEIETDKKYFASLRWNYTPGRAERIIEYLREHLKTAGEAELWHVWQDNGFGHRIRERVISIDELTVDDLEELYRKDVLKEPVTDYCYVITKPKGSAL